MDELLDKISEDDIKEKERILNGETDDSEADTETDADVDEDAKDAKEGIVDEQKKGEKTEI